MIPKIIHYCWLSGEPYPPLVKQCIESWHKHLPDYEFILWDTHRIDIHSNKWLKEAFDNKKYAFAADYIRCYALYNFGGIYLDSDVEVLKNFDIFLNSKSFIGYDSTGAIEAAIVGAEPNCQWLGLALQHYANRPFVKQDGRFDMQPIPRLFNTVLHKCYRFNDTPDQLQKLSDVTLYPYDYFSPKNYQTKKVNKTHNTHSIHHFDGAWIDDSYKIKLKKLLHTILNGIFGNQLYIKVLNIIRRYKKR